MGEKLEQESEKQKQDLLSENEILKAKINLLEATVVKKEKELQSLQNDVNEV